MEVSELYRPARSLVYLRFTQRVTTLGARLDFPGVDSSWGRTCLIRWCHLFHSHLLPLAGFDRRLLPIFLLKIHGCYLPQAGDAEFLFRSKVRKIRFLIMKTFRHLAPFLCKQSGNAVMGRSEIMIGNSEFFPTEGGDAQRGV